MKRTFSITARMTRHYRSGWRHLDNSMYVCEVRTTKAVAFDDFGDTDGWKTRQVIALAPAELAKAKAVYALREPDMRWWSFSQWLTVTIADSMSYSNCRHEHDCCGCVSRYATVHQITPREFVAITRCTPNY